MNFILILLKKDLFLNLILFYYYNNHLKFDKLCYFYLFLFKSKFFIHKILIIY